MPLVQNAPGQLLTDIVSDDALKSPSIPVDLSSNTPKMLYRVVVPAAAGDLLDIDGRARVTNNCGYNIGVGYHLWWYDVDDGIPWPHAQPWTRIGGYNGDNVNSQRHHMPLHTSAVYQVPATWPTGHRMTVVFQADAHSTAWEAGDSIVVDSGYGHLTVRRWTTPDA
jgi:hypothetical protein